MTAPTSEIPPWKRYDGEFSYASTYWSAFRTFRLRRPMPLTAEFFAFRYRLELRRMFGAEEAFYVFLLLPWNLPEHGQAMYHVRSVRDLYGSGVEVECGSITEIMFLRLVRQGDAEELAGPHCLLSTRPQR